VTQSFRSQPDLTSQDDIDLLQDIAASPRPTGSIAFSTSLQRVELELSGMGFETRERPFEYSAFPGRFATPLFGGAVAFTVGVAGHFGAAGERLLPLVVSVTALVILMPAFYWLSKYGVLSLPIMRRRGTNLTATRLASLPRVWICAHLDSKSQPIPTLMRMAGITLAMIGLLATFVLAVLASVGIPMPQLVWAAAALVTLVGSVPVVLSVVGDTSPGALDNASGVAAVIAAARAVPNDSDIGVLITDAEELGLAGAHAWARSRAGGIGGTVLVCDGVDDGGENIVMYSGAKPAELVAAALKAARDTQRQVQVQRMAFGLLTDTVAFADHGVHSITFSRGSYASLARVHSRRDSLENLRGTGIAEVASLLAATAKNLS
jgi:hypothetical protein